MKILFTMDLAAISVKDDQLSRDYLYYVLNKSIYISNLLYTNKGIYEVTKILLIYYLRVAIMLME